ncbi:hypothetical protein GCM10009714_34730 [Microlunatus capsulatus]
MPPAVTVVGLAVWLTTRSASCRTVVVAVALLLAGVGSAVAEVTEAVLSTEVPVKDAATVARTVTVALAEGASVPTAQTTVWPLAEQLPWLGSVLTRVVPSGRVSVMLVEAADDGPALSAVRVYVTWLPAATEAVPVFVSRRSAARVRTVLAVAVLFVGTSSVVAAVTLAVLTTVPAAVVAPTSAVTGMVTVAPLARLAVVQVTVCPLAEQVVPAGAAAEA